MLSERLEIEEKHTIRLPLYVSQTIKLRLRIWGMEHTGDSNSHWEWIFRDIDIGGQLATYRSNCFRIKVSPYIFQQWY